MIPGSLSRKGPPQQDEAPDYDAMQRLVVAAVDVGAPKNIGWWREDGDETGRGGTSLDQLAALLAEDLAAGRSVALGFEAPMFIPRPESADRLNKARAGEGSSPWSGGAGTAVLACGMQQAVYVLSALAADVDEFPHVGLDVETLAGPTPSFVLWEAFVSGRAKDPLADDPHVDDARVAVAEFRRRWAGGSMSSDIADTEVTSTAGLAILVAGLSTDIELLTRPCVVIRAPDLGR